jgi:hypothetical protein
MIKNKSVQFLSVLYNSINIDYDNVIVLYVLLYSDLNHDCRRI